MDNLIDAALGINPHALSLGARRLELLAENLANSDTPGFKARDIDFRATLARVVQDGSAAGSLTTTRPGHLSAAPDHADDVRYRVPNQPSLDGNTVDGDLEKAAFSEAAVRYQASLDFLGSRIEGLRKALRGE
jgi:flagellar basal-body rod protein FlgB